MKISVAYIKGPRGVKGELAAVPHNPSSKNLKEGQKITLEKNGRAAEFEIEFIKRLQKRISIKLKGIDDKETAEYWKGTDALLEKDELEPLDESEYYHFELEGAEVFDENGELIGTVTTVDNNVANAVLNVESDKGEFMVPFVKEIVKQVDIENKRIVIEKIEGLV